MCEGCERLKAINTILVKALKQQKTKASAPPPGGDPDDPMAHPRKMTPEEGIEAWREAWDFYRARRDVP
jgi:hypothetical protein